MKVVVLRKFLDKYTGEIHKPGNVLEITEERFEEILKVGKLVEKVSEEKAEAEEGAEKAPEKKKKSTKKTSK